ncbi:hypothetical protein [Bartonella jaculi]
MDCGLAKFYQQEKWRREHGIYNPIAPKERETLKKESELPTL